MSYDVCSPFLEMSKLYPLKECSVEPIDKLTQEQRMKWISECKEIHENMQMILCDKSVTKQVTYLQQAQWMVRLTLKFSEIALGLSYEAKIDKIEIGSISYERYMELLFIKLHMSSP